MRGGVNVASGWWIGVMAMVVGFIGVCGQVEPGDERRELALAAWGKIGRQSFGEAQREFMEFLPSDPEGRLGLALSQLGESPGDLKVRKEAREILSEVVREGVGDELEWLGRFFSARIMESEMQMSDEVKDVYRKLIEARSGNPLIELLACRLALEKIYRAGTDRQKQEEVLSWMKGLEGCLQTRAGRREFYTSVGFALLENEGDEEVALDYLLRADALGQPLEQLRADCVLAIAGVAERVGKMEVALDYYRRFLKEFFRDNRRYEVERIVEKMEGGGADGGR